MLWQRVLTAVVGIPLTLAVVYAGGWWLVAAIALLTILALREFYHLVSSSAARASAPPPPSALAAARACGYILAVVIPAAAMPGQAMSLPHFAVGIAGLSHFALAIAVLLALASRAGRSPRFTPYLGIPTAALLLPPLFTCLLHLRLLEGEPLAGLGVPLPPGACWLFLVFAACWAGDSAAYGVGRAWGRHKLWPAVSPGKTIEGSLGGLVAAVVVVAAFGRLFGLELYFAAVLGLLLSVAGQLGDLAESKLKRWAGVKDSGSMLPGHGGVLDRFDSLLFSAPVAYCYLRFVVGL